MKVVFVFGGSRERKDAAVELYRKSSADKLILSGYSDDHSVDAEKGEELITRENTFDTIGDLYFLREFLGSNRVEEVYLVSSSWHIPRINLMLKKVLGNCGVKVKYFSVNDLDTKSKILDVLIEVPKTVVDVVALCATNCRYDVYEKTVRKMKKLFYSIF